MRLMYLADGERDYAARPMPPHARGVWEFQAVVAGRLAPTGVGGTGSLAARRLWVFAPDASHGWAGEAGRPCRVVVMHFARVPGVLREAVTSRGGTHAVGLDAPTCHRLRRLAEQLRSHHDRPTTRSPLHSEHALLEMSLWLLRDVPDATPPSHALHKVEQATHWFLAHLDQGVSMEDAARAVHVSPPHLRRLFRRAGGESPRRVFQKLRIARAQQLLAATPMSLKQIADAVGFSGPTVLCRSFKQVTGRSPGATRIGG